MRKNIIYLFSPINIEYVRPSTWNPFLILALCVFEFDTPALQCPTLGEQPLLRYRSTMGQYLLSRLGALMNALSPMPSSALHGAALCAPLLTVTPASAKSVHIFHGISTLVQFLAHGLVTRTLRD